MSSLSYARGLSARKTTESTAEVEVITGTQGSLLGGGISIIVSGSGAGTVKVYFVNASEEKISTDTIYSGAKVADKILAINYGGRLPKFIVSVVPDSGSSMVWDVEVCGVN
tara:strand:+ start:1244 stop:1576 length:333 start_codon:yes stop_codon:yes gene_type:complete